MAKDAAAIQKACPDCQEVFEESRCMANIEKDQRQKYVEVWALLQRYRVAHRKSTPYYPKGNEQAEATNKTLIRILSRTLKEQQNKLAEQLPLALWAYRTTTRGATCATPFSLVYGTEAVFPIEIVIPFGSLAERSRLQFDPRIGELKALLQQREQVRSKMIVYQRRVARAYNATVHPRAFQEGDLVLKTATHVMRNLSAPKFTPKWESPFEVKAANPSGYYDIGRMRSNKVLGTFNAKWLKKYYS
ncbi:uncharacterized protein LOC132310027 [Cornus florida]|uniref:uncharacterized protein LOC132310027 n=1 Tax=Cornus florida TaxID=4283 RepID=UPI00289A8FD0|nr:uncharacterized protein LOC132310027 [Cornus florida]